MHYQTLAKKSSVDYSKPYIFCYIVRQTEQKREAIEKWAKRLEKRVVCVFMYYTEKEKWVFDGIEYLNLKWQECSVEDWLCYMEHSDMVLTDSFHGYCFSMIFKKQVFPLLESSSIHLERFQSLAKLLSLKDPGGCLEIADTSSVQDIYHIAYCDMEKKLEEESARCKRWLLDALYITIPVSDDRLDLMWDAFGAELLSQERDRKKRQREDNRIKCASRDVVVFGTGSIFGKTCTKLAANDIAIKYAVDNNPQKWGNLFPFGAGIVCISPDELKGMKNPFVVISVVDKSVAKEIERQLCAMGIEDVAHISELF